MPGKRNLQRENQIRREETKRRRVEKVINGYVKATYPRIYEEARLFYTNLDAMHQGKKDLTKTPGFQSLVKNKLARMDNFELKIELMEEGTIPRTPEAETTPAPEAAVETTAAPEAAVETTAAPEAAAETTPALLPDLLPLDDDTLQQLIADLQQDPTIQDFFDNFEHEIDNCPLW